jgi:hypothetical protein
MSDSFEARFTAESEERRRRRSLTDRVRGTGADSAVRRDLAELHRLASRPDQAARWGILIDGWTTDYERDRLARVIAASGRVLERDVLAYVGAPPGEPAPRAVRELLPVIVAYRNGRRTRAATGARRLSRRGVATRQGRLRALALALGWSAPALLLVSWFTAWIAALSGEMIGRPQVVSAGAWVLVAVTAALLGLAALANAATIAGDGRRAAAAVWTASGAVIVAGSVLGGVAILAG